MNPTRDITRLRRTTPAFFALLTLLVACAGPGQKHGVPSPEAVEIDGLANARRVGDDLLFGAQPSEQALRQLAAQGYRTVVTTRGEGELEWDERAAVEAAGLALVEIPMNKPVERIEDEWIDRFDELMTTAARPMLVHCGSGNRVAGLWTVWLVERQGVPPEDALELGEAAGLTRLRPVVEERLAGRAD